MSGMDLNQNTQNFERDRLAERVNKVERLMDSFNMEVLESVGNTGKLRVKNISTVNGSLQQVRGKEIDVSTDASSVLDDGDATNRYLVWNATTEAWEPSEMTYPAGSATNRYLTWDTTNSKWIAGKLDTSIYSFGYSVSGDQVTVTAGKVRYGTRDAVSVDGGTVTIAVNGTWIYVAYTYGSTAELLSSTSESTDTETIHNRLLHKWNLTDGVATLVTISHIGDIYIPGAFA